MVKSTVCPSSEYGFNSQHHMAAHNCLQLQLHGIQHPHADIDTGKTPMHMKEKYINKKKKK